MDEKRNSTRKVEISSFQYGNVFPKSPSGTDIHTGESSRKEDSSPEITESVVHTIPEHKESRIDFQNSVSDQSSVSNSDTLKTFTNTTNEREDSSESTLSISKVNKESNNRLSASVNSHTEAKGNINMPTPKSMSIVLKIALIPVFLSAVVGLIIFGMPLFGTNGQAQANEDSKVYASDSDSVAKLAEALTEEDSKVYPSDSHSAAKPVETLTEEVTQEDNKAAQPINTHAEKDTPNLDRTTMVNEYRSKHIKLNSVYLRPSEFFEIKKAFEELPADVRSDMTKEAKQIEYYNMFFTAASPSDVRPLKHYAKAYFTAEQVWMIERTYLYSDKRFYDVYNKVGMSFFGARQVFLEKKWNRH